MRVSHPRSVALAVTGHLILSLAGLPAGAVDVQTHTAPGNTVYMLNETGGLSSRGPLFLGLDYNVLNDPLVELSPDRSQRISTLVDSVMTWDLTAGFRIAHRLSLNATLPLNLAHPVGEGRSFSLGDMRIFAKVPLVSTRSRFHLSFVPEMRVPTGDSSLFLSDGSVDYGFLFAAEQEFRYFSVVANAGYLRAPNAIYRELDYRQRIPLSLGVNIPVTYRWSINGEGSGARVLPFNGSQNPSELYAGARFQATDSLVLQGGASVGAFSDVPSSDYRVLLGLKFETAAWGGGPSEPQASAELVSATSMERSDTLRSGQAHPQATLTPTRIVVNQEIAFAHDSARILPSSKAVLDEVAGLIVANQDQISNVDVEGHCNELGSDAYNLVLSRRRAEAVRDYLVSKNTPQGELHAVGYGKRRPKPGSERLPRAERLRVNRRVEFKVHLKEDQAPTLGQR